ncbi:MAG: BrnT family toxin [Lentisphaeria bacterium]|nr:BrnT family toxin [Lentisphaeria bacterium]
MFAGTRTVQGVCCSRCPRLIKKNRIPNKCTGCRTSAGEDRWITLGLSSSGKLLVVCHTFREETSESAVIRLISSRKATKHESQRYQSS